MVWLAYGSDGERDKLTEGAEVCVPAGKVGGVAVVHCCIRAITEGGSRGGSNREIPGVGSIDHVGWLRVGVVLEGGKVEKEDRENAIGQADCEELVHSGLVRV